MFCEKPIAADVVTSVRVVEEVRATGVPTQIGFQRRFDAGYGAAREALRSGALGELRRVHALTGDREPPAASYIPTSGGIFRDCHVHDFDILRWVTGREVTEVYAVGANRGAAFFAEAGDVDESAAVLTLDDGTLVTLQGSRYNGGGHDVRMELAGTSATWVVGLDAHAALVSAEAGVDFPDGTPWDSFWPRWTPAYVAEMNAFVELALGRRESPCTRRRGDGGLLRRGGRDPLAARAPAGPGGGGAPDVTVAFDVITVGRICVDVYPQQTGVGLADVSTFGKYLGGTATNVAVAAARYGHRTAVVTGTGDDPFGRWIHQALTGFGVDDRWVVTVPDLLTQVTFCEMFPPDDFPLYFYGRTPTAADLQIRPG